MSPELSIIVPVYNEQECLPTTHARLLKELETLDTQFEIIYVDDGSTDNSLTLIRKFSEDDSRVRYFAFSRNFGHEAATTCGLHNCAGKAAIVIDADLQDPPELIPNLVAKWKEGYQVVAGRRKTRDGESWLKKFSAFTFYRILDRFSDVSVPKDVGDFRLVDRRVIDQFNIMGERNRFVRGLFPWIGYRHYLLDYARAPRYKGKTKYSYRKLFWLFLEALSGFSVAPLRLAMIFGLFVSAMSLLAAFAVIIDKLFFGLDLPGYALLAAGMFFLGGVQITFLGLIGEYIGKIYREVQQRPLFIIAEQSQHANARIND